MGASNFNRPLNGVWGSGGVLQSCIMPLAGAKLDAVSGKVKWVAAVTARATGSCLGNAVSQQPLPSKIKGSTAQVASVTDMTLPSDLSTVSFFLMELRSVNMGESRNRETLVHNLQYSS